MVRKSLRTIGCVLGLVAGIGLVTANAQTSQFLSIVRNARLLVADGSASAPSISFANDTDTGVYTPGSGFVGLATNGVLRHVFTNTEYRAGSAVVFGWSSNADPALAVADTSLCRGAAAVIGIGGCTSSFPAIKRNAAILEAKLGDDSTFAAIRGSFLHAVSGFSIGSGSGVMLLNPAAPTISSGFGTSPSIPSNNGTTSFRVNVGTGGAATSGVIGLPAANTGWNCFVQDMTNNTVTRMTASTTTTATFTAAAAWAASDILSVACFAY